MRIITGKQLSRRTVLRGLGAAIALPVLDAMTPALAAPVVKRAPLRLSFVYVPNGIVMKDWTPAAVGPAFQFPRILQPLEPFRQELLVLSGLDAHNGNDLGDGPGDHARAGASFLTGVHCRKTMGADIRNGESGFQVQPGQYFINLLTGGALRPFQGRDPIVRFPRCELGGGF